MKTSAIFLSIVLAFPALVFAQEKQDAVSPKNVISNAIQKISDDNGGNKYFSVDSASVESVVKGADDAINVTVKGDILHENGTDKLDSEPATYVVTFSKKTGDVLLVTRTDETAARDIAKNYLAGMYIHVPEGKVEGDKISYDALVGEVKCKVIMTKNNTLPPRWLVSEVKCAGAAAN